MMNSSAPRLLNPLLSKVRPILASSVQHQLNPDGTLFLAPALSPADFHDQLRERKIASVVLPEFYRDTEIELLIADDDLDRIEDLVTKWPGGPSIKLYSATGGRREHRFNPPGLRPEAHYAMALFPPHLAEQLIRRGVLDDAGVRRLAPMDAFLGCAHRAAYLQSECWARIGTEWIALPEYDTRLRRLASGVGIELRGQITPGKLDAMLDEHGWRPSVDLLERAANWMSWINDVLPPQDKQEEPGVSLFFLRSRAVEGGWQPKILNCLRDNGFELLAVMELEDEQARKAAVEFRGGNWGRGPYRVSGGPPATICVALDLLPISAQARRAQFPDCDNARIVDAKYAARDLVNAGTAKHDHYNPVHSTDNTAQTWRAVRILVPNEEQALREKVERLRKDFATDGVLRDLTKHGRRAKVELIDFDGKLAIRKTFRPSALSFMEREVEVMQRLAPLCSEIPRLFECGSNYFVAEYVGDGAVPPPKRRRGGRPRPLALRHVRKLSKLIATSMANGFDPIDLRADGNVIYTPSGLHLIDFEYWRPCEPAPPEKSMCLSGIPVDDLGHRPLAAARNRDPYGVGWYPYTLLSAESFLYDPPSIQRLKRAWNFAGAYGTWVVRASSFLMKRIVRGLTTRAMTAGVRVIGPRATRLLALQ